MMPAALRLEKPSTVPVLLSYAQLNAERFKVVVARQVYRQFGVGRQCSGRPSIEPVSVPFSGRVEFEALHLNNASA